MKHLSILLFAALLWSSCEEENASRKIVNSFVETTILNEEPSEKSITDFIAFNPKLSKEDQVKSIELSRLVMLEIRDKIKACEHAHQIISYRELSHEPLISYKFEYSEMENVYFLTCDNQVLAPIVVKNGKVVAFYTQLNKIRGSSFKPYLLD